jgi:superfamily II DNA or RNA helicase
VGGLLYHSKLPTKEREQVLEDFSNNTTNILVAVGALNEGLNVPDLDAAICASGVSTELSFIQQLGRVVRFKEGKHAIFINLYTKDTVEKRWIETKIKSSKIKSKWVETTTELRNLFRE